MKPPANWPRTVSGRIALALVWALVAVMWVDIIVTLVRKCSGD